MPYYFLLCLAFLAGLSAHPLDITNTFIRPSEGNIEARINILSRSLGVHFLGSEQGMTLETLPQYKTKIEEYVTRHFSLYTFDGTTLPLSGFNMKTTTGSMGFTLVLILSYPATESKTLILDNRLFFNTFPLQNNLVNVGPRKDPNPRRFVTHSQEPRVLMPNPVSDLPQNSAGANFVDWIKTGLKHISEGIDHIVFILAIHLAVRNLWAIVKIITSFTLAHSLTLFLAVFGYISLPPAFVEAMVALTIVFVGVENFFLKDVQKRWRVTFFLGLIHGVGFAYTIDCAGFSGMQLLQIVFAFNLGVELGQLLIVLCFLPLLYWISRWPELDRAVVLLGSGAVILAGSFWFLSRTGWIFGV